MELFSLPGCSNTFAPRRLSVYSMSAVIFGICLRRGVTADISGGISELSVTGQACVKDKDRIVSPLPPSLFSPFRLGGPVLLVELHTYTHTYTHCEAPKRGAFTTGKKSRDKYLVLIATVLSLLPPLAFSSVTFSLARRSRSPGGSRTLNTPKKKKKKSRAQQQ